MDHQSDEIVRPVPILQPDFAAFAQSKWSQVTLSSIGDAVITTDNSGNVTFLNPVAQALTGWNQNDAFGQPLELVFEIVNESTRETVENPATKALRAGVIVGLANHTILIARDRSECPIEDSAAPIRNEEGEVDGVVLVFRDVTERKKQEQLSHGALEYADNILATLREPFLVLDKHLRVTSANQSFYETYEVKPDDTQGVFVYELGNGQWDIPALRNLLEEVLPQNHAFQDFEVEHNFTSVGWKCMLLNARRIRQPGNDSELILLAIEDITERRRTQSQLAISETRFRRLFESCSDGILILDAREQKITHVNPFLTKLLGFPSEYFVGKELWEIGVLKDKEASRLMINSVEDLASLRYENLPLLDRFGREHPVELVAIAYVEGSNTVIQCNIRDIHERRQMETLLRKQAADLSDLHRRKDEFLAMLSHELRSPLAPIANAIQLLALQKADENPIQQRARKIIERQAGQMQHLVDDLLEVSRFTTGRVHLRRELVSIRRIIEAAVETTKPLVEQRFHRLTITIPSEPIWINADAARIEQVLVNLITNAAKYTEPSGDIWLTATHEKDECVVSVRDSGTGIAPALLPHIFEIFIQASRTLDRAEGGLGIGLALVERLTELHGGRVEAFSTFGKGSEFIVWLPVAAIDPPIPSPPISPLNSSTRPLRVLVVDDNQDTVSSFAMLLTALGHQVTSALDGLVAVQLAIESKPDVMILDIGLPGLNGYEVAKRLRQIPEMRALVLIALTGYGQDTDRFASKNAGFDHHLVKPARVEQLQKIFATVIAMNGIEKLLP